MLSLWVLARTIPAVHRFTHRPEAGVADEVAQDRAFKRCHRGGTTLARPRQIDREVERDFAVLNHRQPFGESHRVSDVVSDENGGEALIMLHPLQ